MDTIGKFIRRRLADFQENPPQGHEERFLEKMREASATRQAPVSARKIKRIWLWNGAAVAVLVLAITLWGLFFSERNKMGVDPCAGSDYLCYKAQTEKIAIQIQARSAGMDGWKREEIQAAVEQLAPEAYALESSLPEEMSRTERERVLTVYYARMYEGIKQVASSLSSY